MSSTPFEPIVLAATLLMIPVIIIERDAESDGWVTAAFTANWIIWAVFALELVFVLVIAPRKAAALRAGARNGRPSGLIVEKSRRNSPSTSTCEPRVNSQPLNAALRYMHEDGTTKVVP